MTLFILFIALLVIGSLLMFLGVFHGIDKDGDFVSEAREWSVAWGFVFALIGALLGVIFGISALCANSQRFNNDKLIEYQNKRSNIVFLLNSATQDNLVKVSDMVREYNYDVTIRQEWNRRSVTNWITYDIWDQLELIDYSEYAKTPKEYSVNITQNGSEDAE